MKFASASAIYVAANAISAGIPFLLLPFLTRVLSPAEYGEIVGFFLLVTTCGTFAGLSVHGALSVAWFKQERADLSRLVGAALAVGTTSTALVAAIVVLILQTALGASLGVSAVWGAAAATTAGCNVLLQCQLVLWQNQQRPVPLAIMQVCASMLNVGLSLAFVMLLDWRGAGRNAGAFIAAMAMAICAVGILFQTKQAALSLRWSDVRSLLAFGLPLLPHSMAGVLLATADRYMVSSQLGPPALGIYGAAAQLGTVMVILGDAFVKAFKPWLYTRFASNSKDDSLTAVGAMYASIPAFLMLATLLGVALWLASSLLLGPAYRSALTVLPLFLLGGAFNCMYLAVSGLYFFSGRTGLLSSVTLPVAVLGVLLSLGFTLRWGLDGAALGYAITQGLLTFGAWVVASRTFPLPWSQPLVALAEWWPFVKRIAP